MVRLLDILKATSRAAETMSVDRLCNHLSCSNGELSLVAPVAG
jgi:hypothetical protein